jgi:MFS transporter, MHS family, alpha-ketoglutarate permease
MDTNATVEAPGATPRRPVGSRLRSIVAGSAGNLVEWYDWYVYSAFSLYFASVFFPSGDRTARRRSSPSGSSCVRSARG